MNRTEFAASVKALVGVEVNEKEILPQDIQVDGFDNVASALTVSPSFLDQYITAARRIAKNAVGNMHPPIQSFSFKGGKLPGPDASVPAGLPPTRCSRGHAESAGRRRVSLQHVLR